MAQRRDAGDSRKRLTGFGVPSNEYGEVLDVLLQENRNTGATKRFFRRLIDDQDIPECIVTDGLRSYGAALRELGEAKHVMVSTTERQNNLALPAFTATQ